MERTGRAEYLIEEVIGCGRFQFFLFIFQVLLVKIGCAFSATFMAFGNYNPGWRCLDNDTALESTVNGSHLVESSKGRDNDPILYEVGSCQAYKTCQNVEFNPEASTIVTEWGLLCDKSWMVTITIAIQMLGMLFGSFFGGQLADWVGRKKTLYGCVLLGAVLQLLSSFSVSWEMFTAVRFFLGYCAISNLVITYLYMSETMTKDWRASSFVIPDWQMGTLAMGLSAVILKDWRQMELTVFVISVIALIPSLWVPESLRWLEVMEKLEKFTETAEKMARLNQRANFTQESKHLSLRLERTALKEENNSKKYTILDIFRKGYIFKTISVGFLNLTFSIIYYAIGFGVKSLYGNFYFNLILMTLTEFPVNLITFVSFKYVSRRLNALLFLLFSAVCMFTTTGFLFSTNESVKATGSTTLIAIAKASLGGAWYIIFARTTELYPTVVRGLSFGWGSTIARVGGILAPFLIPKDQDSLYIYMACAGAVTIVCSIISTLLPETKGKPLKEKFDEDEEEDLCVTNQTTLGPM